MLDLTEHDTQLFFNWSPLIRKTLIFKWISSGYIYVLRIPETEETS